MATLAQNAADIADCATAIDTAITTKGGTLVGGGKLRNAAAGIASIPTVSSSGWNPPDWMYDIREVLRNDTETGYAHKVIYLLNDAEDTVYVLGQEKLKFSDGTETTSSERHTWDKSKDIVFQGRKFRWVIRYSNSDFVYNVHLGSKTTYWVFNNDNANILVNGIVNSCSQCFLLRAVQCKITFIGTVQNAFWGSGALEYLENVDTTDATNVSQLFNGCYNLYYIGGNISLLNATNVTNMFSGTYALKHLPSNTLTLGSVGEFGFNGLCNYSNAVDIIANDATSLPCVRDTNREVAFGRILCNSATTASQYCNYSISTFDYCEEFRAPNVSVSTAIGEYLFSSSSLVYIDRVPRIFTFGSSFKFNQNTFKVDYKDRFARFDSNGNLVDGMAFNMNTVTGGQTATISATLKGFFTATEQAKIAEAFTNKGWTLAW